MSENSKVFVTNERLPIESVEPMPVVSAQPLSVVGNIEAKVVNRGYEYRIFSNVNEFGTSFNDVPRRLIGFLNDGWEVHYHGQIFNSPPMLILRRPK